MALIKKTQDIPADTILLGYKYALKDSKFYGLGSIQHQAEDKIHTHSEKSHNTYLNHWPGVHQSRFYEYAPSSLDIEGRKNTTTFTLWWQIMIRVKLLEGKENNLYYKTLTSFLWHFIFCSVSIMKSMS